MRELKSSIYAPHPNPLPNGEGIFRDAHKVFLQTWSVYCLILISLSH